MKVAVTPAVPVVVVLSVLAAGCASGNGRFSVPFAEPVTRQAADAELTASAAPVKADAFTVVLDRMRAEYLGINAWQAPAAITTLGAGGLWSDIRYGDRSAGEWAPMAHLERVRAMVVAYSATQGPYRQSAAVRSAIILALRAWVARHPQSDNWWHNTIGVQLAVMPILVLMDAELPADLRDALLSTIAPLAAVPAGRKTGQNLVWYATQHIVKGALTRNSADIEAGLDAIRSTLAITTSEGIQADLSFHQHGPQLYTGGYGLAYFVDVMRLAHWLQGTPWRFSEDALNLLADYVTVGIGPLVRGQWLDWSARGREITRLHATNQPAVLRTPINYLLSLAPNRTALLTALNARLRDGTPPVQASSHGYWRSDFLVHQTPKGYFSIKMMSRRTVGTESGNGENLLGYWLPFGATFIVGSGNGSEYQGLQPLLDWSAIPGTTAPQVVPRFSGYLRHDEDRAAVLSDSSYGMASLQVNTQGLLAKKFWFVDGDVLVALGTDISYTGQHSVRTTLNQTRWLGAAQSDTGALTPSTDPVFQHKVRQLVHGGVGYVLLDPQEATATVEEHRPMDANPTVSANSGDAHPKAAASVMTLTIDHGAHPQDASYAYAVLHGVADSSQLQAVDRPKVLANTAQVQGVMSADGSRLAAAFHQPGHIDLGQGLALHADHAVAVLGHFADTRLQLQTVDLAGKGATVTLRVARDGHTVSQQTLSVPSNLQRTRPKPAARLSLETVR